MKYDVFISYSRKDQILVSPFCYKLEREGFNLFSANDDFLTGSDYASLYIRGIKGADVVLFFYSKNASNSIWCKKEIELAISLNKKIVPILLDDIEFDESFRFLLKKQYFKFDKDWTLILNYLRSYLRNDGIECCKSYNNQSENYKSSELVKNFRYWGFIFLVLILIVGFLIVFCGSQLPITSPIGGDSFYEKGVHFKDNGDLSENNFLNRIVFLLCFCSVVSFVIGGVVVWFICRKKIQNNIDIVEPQHDKLIKCFIAGSKSLQRERDGLRATMSGMYNKWMNFDFKILSFTFEDFDKKVVIGGQQKLYNSFIEKDADWALFIIDKGIGDKTHEEYKIAMDSYINNGRPNIVIFGKLGISDMSELSIIKEEVEKYGQYWVDYSDIEHLKLSFESILNWDLINIFKDSFNS